MVELTLPPDQAESRWEWPATSHVPEPTRRRIEAMHAQPQQQARVETENAELRAANARLEQQIARQDQRLARVERGITMLRVELYGGTVQQLRDAGITVKAGNEPADGKIRPLHEKMIDGMATALADVVKQERAAVATRLDALEARPVYIWKGPFVEGSEHSPGHLVQRGGSVWLCVTTTTGIPGKCEDFALFARSGRDGRDLMRKEPTLA